MIAGSNPFGWLRPLLDPNGDHPGDEFTVRVIAVFAAAAAAGVLLRRWWGDMAAVPLAGETLVRLGPVAGRGLLVFLTVSASSWMHAAVLAGTDWARGLDPRARWRR